MDELSITMKARAFIANCGSLALPVLVERYAAEIGGSIKKETLGENEDAWSVRLPSGKYRICVNCAHNSRRQRFSVCHEVAHAVLEIPADHSQPSWRYSQRPQGEIFCDIFAAELLLPYELFKPRVDTADMGFAAINMLASEFDASLISTGSRFATFSREPCAFVLSEGGKVRYCARSAALRDARAWIKPGSTVPAGSYSARVREGENPTGPEEAAPDEWFEDWERDGELFEDVFHLERWDQTLTLLWFEDGDIPPPRPERKQWDEQAYGLRELDGTLPWPGGKKRR
jgi:hypothetical protein